MRSASKLLINTPDIEIWPAGLLRARANRDARALARSRHVLRRKRDGRYLAAELPEGVLPLVQGLLFVFSVAVILMNTLADLIYPLLDPRVGR